MENLGKGIAISVIWIAVAAILILGHLESGIMGALIAAAFGISFVVLVLD